MYIYIFGRIQSITLFKINLNICLQHHQIYIDNYFICHDEIFQRHMPAQLQLLAECSECQLKICMIVHDYEFCKMSDNTIMYALLMSCIVEEF